MFRRYCLIPGSDAGEHVSDALLRHFSRRHFASFRPAHIHAIIPGFHSVLPGVVPVLPGLTGHLN
ncbi:MAG: hypothetical protein J5699_00520 [Bacteroidales bacterium]|nr:hypothetical protein [Bacteroidales bacterium]